MRSNFYVMKLAFAAAVLIASSAQANVCNGDDVVFFCTAKNNKIITVCHSDTTFTYRFGKIGKKTDLEIKRSVADIVKNPWSGAGSSISQSIDFKKGDYTYGVYSSYDRNGAQEEHGGVTVNTGKKVIKVPCTHAEDTMVDNIDVYTG